MGKGKILIVLFLLFLFSCGLKTSEKIQKEEIRVAVLLPLKGKWEYREYFNGREVRSLPLPFSLFDIVRARKGFIYSNMARDRVQEALNCEGLPFIEKKKKVEVVDRKTIDKILQEQKLHSSGLIDRETAVKIGKLAGANIIALVEPRYISFKEDRYKKKVKDFVVVGKEKIKYCVSYRASTALYISVVDVETGKVYLSGLFKGKSDKKEQCSEEGYRTDKLPPHDDVIDEAIKDATDNFSSKFCKMI